VIIQHIIIALLFTILGQGIIYMLFRILFNIKEKKRSVQFIISTIVLLFISTFISKVHPTATIMIIKTLSYLGVNIIASTIIFKTNILKNVLVVFFSAMLMAIGNFAIFGIYSMLGKSHTLILETFVGQLLGLLIIGIVNVIVLFLLWNIMITNKQIKMIPSTIKKRALLINSFFVVIVAIFIGVNIFMWQTYVGVINPINAFVSIGVILALMIFSLLNINTFCRLEMKTDELEYQTFYNKSLQNLVDDIRSFKHNYNNMLSVMGGYASLKKWDLLEKLIIDEVDKSVQVNIKNSILDSHITDAGLLGLLSHKIEYAHSKSVYMQIDNEGLETNFKVSISLLSEILGVLIDNAIEAASISDLKFVNLRLKTQNAKTMFYIENSYKDAVDMKEMFKKNASSKGANRGFGLWHIQKKINENKNIILNTKVEKMWVQQSLTVYNEN
jgi:two-component system sensor histidine kinase AgrC